MNDQDFTIPRDIEARYEGRWIAWDTDTERRLRNSEVYQYLLDRHQSKR